MMNNQALLSLLKALEWQGTEVSGLEQLTCRPYVIRCCPYCRRDMYRKKHSVHCNLANTIKELEDAGKVDNQELPKSQETGD